MQPHVSLKGKCNTLHNFQHEYRAEVHQQIYRVLKPMGQLVNGDRYGLDDISKHTQTIQHEVAGYFRTLDYSFV